jgi:hypothetical protein
MMKILLLTSMILEFSRSLPDILSESKKGLVTMGRLDMIPMLHRSSIVCWYRPASMLSSCNMPFENRASFILLARRSKAD